MDFLDNSEESVKIRNNLFTLLNSNNEQDVDLAAQILWNIKIPDEWILFIFQKAKYYPSLNKLLREHFPQKEFEVAHKWFSFSSNREQSKNLYLLSLLPSLHKAFDWKHILPLYFIPLDYPFFVGGTADDIDLPSSIFNYKYIPKNELISIRIDKDNILRLPAVKKLPSEISIFPYIEGIITEVETSDWKFNVKDEFNGYPVRGVSNKKYRYTPQKTIHNLPLTILKMDNLKFIHLGGEGTFSYLNFKIAGLPFSQVLRKYKPSLLINLHLFNWIDYSYQHPIEELMSLIGDMNIDQRVLKFLNVVELLQRKSQNEALHTLKELYEQDSFYLTLLGSDLSRVIKPLEHNFDCIVYLLDFFEKQNYRRDKDYTFVILKLILHDYDTDSTPRILKICQRGASYVQERAYKLVLKGYEIMYFLKLNRDSVIYEQFRSEFDQFTGFEEALTSYSEGMITNEEVFNYLFRYFRTATYQDSKNIPLQNLIEKFEREYLGKQ